MSDSFADLWNSTAPAKPAEPSRTLGSLTPNAAQPRKPQNDVFSMLAAAGSNANSRSTTPSYTGGPQTQRAAPGGTQLRTTAPAASSSGDAFSDLLSGVTSTKTNAANMTIAERAALAEKQRLERLRKDKQPSDASPSAWAGLDALASSTPSVPPGSSRSSSLKPPEDDWGLSFGESTHPAPKPPVITKTAPANDNWDLDDFISQPAPSKPSAAQAERQSSRSLWDDLDGFTSQSSRAELSSRASPAPGNGRSSTPGSFDFGDREGGLLDDQSDNEDNILGELGKPVQARSLSSDHIVRATPSPQPPNSGQGSRPVSPPPHIVGQIVEMGFTPQQARVALASTDTGLDVQAALDILLANGAGSSTPPPSEEPRRRERPRERERERFRDTREEDEAPPRIHPRRDRQREPPSRENSSSIGEGQRGLSEQADELLAQASKIGLSVFNRANALWNVGKEKVQKAYEERAASAGGAKVPAGRKDSRPRWMQEATESEEDGWGDRPTSSVFRDDHDEAEALPPHPDETPRAKLRSKAPERVAKSSSRPAEDPSSRLKTGDLLVDDTPSVYVSPFRRKVPPRAQAPASVQQASTPAAAPAKAPSPLPLIQRKTISASSSAIAASAKHKAAGTEMFKLGRYAEAETSYSHAITALPDSHLLLVPLYNNRALTRIKTGDHAGAIEDATTALTIIGSSYHPAREAKVTREDEGAGVDLADAYIKALRRRAEAYEGREKWDAARKDWETLAGTEWAGKARNEAAQAAGRCRRMVAMEKGGSVADGAPVAAVSATKPRPKPKPISRIPTPPSEALNRVREAAQAAEAEDNERHALKDTVDSRLTAWKGGKETNIRALIASLDTVLWPELGWQKVGMHELVTPAQVKIRYTKAIAKLHPDKLNVNNTTLEQRMIANGVFGALNEAWNVFKP